MRLRSVVTALALTAGALVTSSLAASAEVPNSITKVDSGYFLSLWQPAGCTVGYGTGLVVNAQVDGPFFDEHPDDSFDGVTARVTLNKGGEKLATLVAEGDISPAREGGRVLSLGAFGCTVAKKLRAAGVGLSTTTYSVRIESASFHDAGGVKRNLNAGKARNVVAARTVRTIADSRTAAGSSYVWKGRVQLLTKSGSRYTWAATGKNLAVQVIATDCSFDNVVTTTGGRFSVKVPTSVGRKLVLAALPTATLSDSFGTYATIVDGKVRNGAVVNPIC